LSCADRPGPRRPARSCSLRASSDDARHGESVETPASNVGRHIFDTLYERDQNLRSFPPSRRDAKSCRPPGGGQLRKGVNSTRRGLQRRRGEVHPRAVGQGRASCAARRSSRRSIAWRSWTRTRSKSTPRSRGRPSAGDDFVRAGCCARRNRRKETADCPRGRSAPPYKLVRCVETRIVSRPTPRTGAGPRHQDRGVRPIPTTRCGSARRTARSTWR